ncbi:hypothetical protein KC717_02580 [Candidatus Dojkabacteria bacterium]|uniref:Septum formation initiator family protein n=1 Tax=Candidatus Dojkabacteria bacterium TaxID=2099670 RepID=A0A955RK48_9BACT|nr:hypothetical protein [Candidatus Dojkabacteria bacterium]
MKFARLTFLLKRITNKVAFKRPQFNVSPKLLVLGFITLILSLFLVQNIANSLHDLGNYEILSNEQAILEELQQENEKLVREKSYYQSPYYVRLYARESLNLVEEGQELYRVERSKTYDYDEIGDRMEGIDILNNRYWWRELIL